MARKHRDYDNDYPSVTTVLSGLRKIALEMWFRNNTPEFINRESGKGKTIGTDIHHAIENYINTGKMEVETQYPDEVLTCLKSFVMFKKEHPEIKFNFSELKMTSLIYSYNGTMDLDAEIDGYSVVGDWKSGKCGEKDKPDVYDEFTEQLSAYDNLNIEVRSIKASHGFIAVFAKDKVAYNLKWVSREELDGAFKNVFLPALLIWRYKNAKRN